MEDGLEDQGKVEVLAGFRHVQAGRNPLRVGVWQAALMGARKGRVALAAGERVGKCGCGCSR